MLLVARVPASVVLLALVASCGAPAPPPAPTARVTSSALAERSAHWVDWLARYLAVDTTVPPGHEADAIPILTEALTEIGLTVTTTTWGDRRANVWATLSATQPTGRPLILLHHIDVVPIEREHWTAQPFAGERRDGRLYGRGALDMKSFAALHLAALERLVSSRDRLQRDVIFLAVADEEVEGEGSRRFIAEQLGRVDAEYLLDEGGFALHEFLPGHDVAVIATAQKRAAKLRLVAEGRAGHGSRPVPDGGPSVLIQALTRALAAPAPMRIAAYNAPLFEALSTLTSFPQSALLARIRWPGVLSALEGRLSKDKNLNPVLRDTAALTVLRAGDKDNVIPSEATAVLDVRLLPDTELDVFIADLRAAIGDLPVRIEVLDPPDPPITPSPTDDPLFRALVDAVRAHTPAATVVPWLMVGASDSRFFQPRGVKTYGFGPVFVTRPDLDGIHGHDESVDIAALEKGMVVYAEALERFLLPPSP